MWLLWSRPEGLLVTRILAVSLLALVWPNAAFCSQIHDAAAAGNLNEVKVLLRGDPNLASSKDEKGNTPLHWAAKNGHTDVAEELLKSKAEIDAQNNTGQTALHEAAFGGFKSLVELLLTNKANVNARSYRGYTALHLAASAGNRDVVEILLANGANVNARSNLGFTPLQASMAHPEIADLLRQHGARE